MGSVHKLEKSEKRKLRKCPVMDIRAMTAPIENIGVQKEDQKH